MSESAKFGEFIKSNRITHGLSQKQIADMLGITPVYLCDIEKGRRYPPNSDTQLTKLAEILKLAGENLSVFYDLAGFEKKCVSPDISDYIMSSDIIRAALRLAKVKATSDDWTQFINRLEQR